MWSRVEPDATSFLVGSRDGPDGSPLALRRRVTPYGLRMSSLLRPLLRQAALAAGLALGALALAADQAHAQTSASAAPVHGPAVLPAVGTTVAGRVVGWPDSLPIAGALVSVEALGRSALATRDGFFQLSGLPAGTHTLVIRQVGFRPAIMTVRVMGLADLPSTDGRYTVALARLPALLDLVVVRGRGSERASGCREAGFRGRQMDPRVRPVLEQLEANVERMRDIGRRFPLEYRVARTRHLRVETGALVAQRGDTVLRRSDVRRPYAPGRVLETRLLGERGVMGREMFVPGVVDLADSTFQDTHCFRYAGVERQDGRLVHRIDFAPLDRLYDADVAGSLWLDAHTWWLVRSSFRLTRVPVTMRVRAVEVTAEYREARPGIVVPQALFTVETVRGVKVGGARITEFLQRDQVFAWRWAGDEAVPDEREASR